MTQYKRILFATDFSETSAYAVEHALLMARTFGSELHLLHVLETEIPIMMDGMAYLPPDYFEEIEKIAVERLESVITRENRDKLSVTLLMRRGAPSSEIVRYSHDQKMDLIVLGTHGRGAIAHVFLGNVAEKVVRQSPCPVLTVRHPKHEFVAPF